MYESRTGRRKCSGVQEARSASVISHFGFPRSPRFLYPFTVARINWFFGIPWFLRPSRIGGRNALVLGLTLGFSLSLSLTGLAIYARDAWKRSIQKKAEKRLIEVKGEEIVDGVEGLIGNTPLVRINSLSDLTGVEILGKCEFLNPFGSVKDRVSLRIITQAEDQGLIHPHSGSCIFEGTSGSTGISIAGIARARGYKAHIVLPDDVAKEKVQLLEALGAEVEKVRPVSIVDKRHYVNLARLRAQEFGKETLISTTTSTPRPASPSPTEPPTPESLGSSRAPSPPKLANLPDPDPSAPPSLLITSQPAPSASSTTHYIDPPRGLFSNQFENLSNLAAHEEGTAPEIWKQTNGSVDAFVSGAGTGGTIAGVGKALKRWKESVEIVLADPQGSGLFHKIHDGVMYSETESEGKRRRYQVDTIVEGIGLNRLTRNFSHALPFIDDAFRVTDAEAVAMSRHLAREDGLFLGSSSAVNLVTCVRLAQKWGEAGNGKTIVTILCDSGARHHSRFWNDEYLAREGIPVATTIDLICPPRRSESPVADDERVGDELGLGPMPLLAPPPGED